MKIYTTLAHTIIVGAFAGAIGCAVLPGTTTTPAKLASFQATSGELLPPPLVDTDRTVQADLDRLDVDTFDSMVGQLPQRISVADAEKLLVKIDPSKITEGKAYSVLRGGGGHGGGGHGGGHGGHGGFHGSSFHGHGHFRHGNGFFNNSFFGGFGYYPYSNYYFPYYGYGSYYYPYSYGGYLPFLYGYNSLLNPYTYGGYAGGLPWSGTQMPPAPAPQQQPQATPTPMAAMGTTPTTTTGTVPGM